MDKPRVLTTESGAPVTDNQNSRSAGADGPLLLEDHYLIEKLAHFERDRINGARSPRQAMGRRWLLRGDSRCNALDKANFLSPARFATRAGSQ